MAHLFTVYLDEMIRRVYRSKIWWRVDRWHIHEVLCNRKWSDVHTDDVIGWLFAFRDITRLNFWSYSDRKVSANLVTKFKTSLRKPRLEIWDNSGHFRCQKIFSFNLITTQLIHNKNNLVIKIYRVTTVSKQYFSICSTWVESSQISKEITFPLKRLFKCLGTLHSIDRFELIQWWFCDIYNVYFDNCC